MSAARAPRCLDVSIRRTSPHGSWKFEYRLPLSVIHSRLPRPLRNDDRYRRAADTEEMPVPDMIVLSKPDLFDRAGALRRHGETDDFEVTHRLMALQVFERR